MQIKKDEIRNNIINSAIEIFLEQGFYKTSMQSIAKKASISTSNIYNYFTSKKQLFEYIVKPVADDLNWMIQTIMIEEEQNEEGLNGVTELIIKLIKEIIKKKHKEMILLFDCSQGSDYSKYKDDLVSLLEKHIIESFKGSCQKNEMKLTLHIIVNNLLEGILEIARHYQSEQQTSEVIKNFITYHLSGINSFL